MVVNLQMVGGLNVVARGFRCTAAPASYGFAGPHAYCQSSMGPSNIRGKSFKGSTPCLNLIAMNAVSLGAAVATARQRRSLFSMASRAGHVIARAQTSVTAPPAEKTALETQIEEAIALHPVVMISKTTCPFCAQAKQAFQQAGFTKMAVIELDRFDPEIASKIQDHMAVLTGARTVPRVFVGRKFIGGGTDVAQLAQNGELKGLVDNAVAKHQEGLKGEGDFDVKKSEADWKQELDGQSYRILRMRGTEPPNSHEYNQFYPSEGYFGCAACDLPLYSASSKFQSNCGWPVFDKCYFSEEYGCHVGTRSDGTGSLEIICEKCGSHLGHVFFDAHSAENLNGERH